MIQIGYEQERLQPYNVLYFTTSSSVFNLYHVNLAPKAEKDESTIQLTIFNSRHVENN